MSKYVIELDEDVKILQSISVTPNGNAYTNTQWQANLEEINSDYINEHFGELQDTAYQKGFADAKAIHEKGCDGCKYQANKEPTCPCSECANNYKNQWTAKSPVDDGFVRGDVVVDENGIKGIVVSSDNDEDSYFYVLYDECQVPQRVTQRYYKKTGEHYDIDKYLKEINRSKIDDIC